MNKKLFNTRLMAAVLSLIPMASCSDIEDALPSGEGGEGYVATRFSGLPDSELGENGEERLSSISIYHFKGNEYLFRTDVADPYGEDISLPTQGTTRIHCLSGLSLSSLEGISEGELLKQTATSPAEGSSAPLFYSGSADFSFQAVSSRRIDVAMTRSVARIDFINRPESRIEIERIIVENAPAATFIFAQDSVAETSTVSYTRQFSTPFYGEETGMFTLFESSRPVNVRIIGSFDDSPLNTVVTLPDVKRNKIYTLQMVKADSKVEGAFTVSEWAEGDSTTAVPATGKGLFIDPLNSYFPEGVKADCGSNVVSVSHEGAKEIKVAFTAATPVTIASTEGAGETVKVTPNPPVAVDGGYVSSFNAEVAPNNRMEYTVTVNIKDEAGNYNFVEFRILENTRKEFETVEIAGLTWMAFNALSSDPADQIFPIDGLSVEEMYQKNWPRAIGNFFQYGRKKGYSPWTKNDPNGNEETPRNIPWNNPESMPLPPGYHVTTQAEWLQLLPAGTTLPGVYTAGNGETIKGEIVTLPARMKNSPSAAANNANLFNRYLRFESQETGNVLILPVAALKTAGWDEYPGGGQAMHARASFWIAEDRYVWLFQVGGAEDALTCTQGINRWNYNGFMPVRGVKDHD